MSNYVPTKQHLREVLLYYYNSKKSAAESHRLLLEAYGKHTPNVKTCTNWFRRFESGDFNTEDKERTGQPRKFTDQELEELLEKDPSLTLEEIAQTFGVNRTTISKRLKAMGMVQM